MNLLKALLRRSCPHQFAWPRIDDNGRHYQICLACGSTFEYDWKKMRRGKLRAVTVTPTTTYINHGPLNTH